VFNYLLSFLNTYNLNSHIISAVKNRLLKYPTTRLRFKLIRYYFLSNKKRLGIRTVLDLYNSSSSYLIRIRRILYQNIKEKSDLVLMEQEFQSFFRRLRRGSAKLRRSRQLLLKLLMYLHAFDRVYYHGREFVKTYPRESYFIRRIVSYLYKRQAHRQAYSLLSLIPFRYLPSDLRFIFAEYLFKKDKKRAALILKDLVHKRYQRDRALRMLADYEVYQGKFQKALSYLKKIYRQKRTDWENTGNLYLFLGKYSYAVAHYRRLSQPLRSIRISLVFLQQGKIKKAENEMYKAFKVPAHRKKIDQGLDLLFMIRNLKKDKKSLVLFAGAKIFSLQKKYLEAAGIYLKLAKRTGVFSSGRALLAAGHSYAAAGLYKKAVQIFNRLITAKSPLKDRALYHKGMLLKYRLSQKKRGDACFFELVAKFPHSVYLYKSRRELTGE